MAYTQVGIRTKIFNHQIKASDWLESNIVCEYYFAHEHTFIKLFRMSTRELKNTFSLDAVNIYEEYYGLQREISR